MVYLCAPHLVSSYYSLFSGKRYNKLMDLLEKVTSLAKRRGFIYPGSEIYGGLANTYDFGPLGVELKNNIKRIWWERFVTRRPDIYGLDGGILMNPKIWEASGHVENFTDPLVECVKCHRRHREDQLSDKTKCPDCGGKLTEPQRFNGMFRTSVGATEDKGSEAYLRPETAQAIFVNFKNVLNTFSPKLPFGIAQIGKAFRNEITLGYYIFRMLEFEQMEIEYFIEEKGWEKVFSQWQEEMMDFAVSLGIDKRKLKFREHDESERSHYSKKTADLEYEFPVGYKELYGLAYRTNFDLTNHAKHSGVELSYLDSETGKRIVPHVVEPSFGVERTMLPILMDAYGEQDGKVTLKLDPAVAPYKVAVFPLLANKPELVAKAREIFNDLLQEFSATWDARGNIGKRYAAQDEIGTPWCVTVDFETERDNAVTVRDRDTKAQERVPVDKLVSYFKNKLKG